MRGAGSMPSKPSKATRDYAKRLDAGLAACAADLKTVEAALLFGIAITVEDLARITDIPARRVHAAIFLLREHNLAEPAYGPAEEPMRYIRKDPAE